MEKIVLATNNKGKLRELREKLSGLPIQFVAQSEYNVPEVDETGLTFVENALIKARQAACYCQLPAVADDSGLEIDALQGAPGIRSARFSGEQATDEDNINAVLAALKDVGVEERSARFHCVIVLLRHERDPSPFICQGVWEGVISRVPSGSKGFGYDPIFYLPAWQCTAAEFPLSEKNRISHRAQAVSQLCQYFYENKLK